MKRQTGASQGGNTMKELKENEIIGMLLELEKYKFIDRRIIAEIVVDIFKIQATNIDGLDREVTP